MKIYRIISLILMFAVLLSFASCVTLNLPEDTKENGGDTESETEAATTEYDYDIVKNSFRNKIKSYINIIGRSDFGGASFLIATPDAGYVDSDSRGVALSEAVLSRNREVERNFNVKISSKAVLADALYDEVCAAVAADDFYADLIMIPQNEVYAYAVSGALLNLNSLPFSDFVSGFNIKSATSSAMANSTGWAVGGWATLNHESLPAVFFNKDLIELTGLEDPYELVRRGEWTWDRFFEYASAIPESYTQIYSYGTQSYAATLADVIYFSEGNKFVSSGLGVSPSIAMDSTTLAHTFETEQRVYNDTSKIQNPFLALDTFKDGYSVFLIEPLGTMKTIANSSAVWGVLPMPKKDASQENYCSIVSPDSLMMAVPANCKSAEKASKIISALNVCSIGTLVDSYLTDCMYYYLRDNESISSVEAICYSATWDMAYTASGYESQISNCTYFAVRDIYENGRDLDTYLNYYSDGAVSALNRLFP